jgi:hypothetical protein
LLKFGTDPNFVAIDEENLSPVIAAHFRRIKFAENVDPVKRVQSRFEEWKFMQVHQMLCQHGLDTEHRYAEFDETADEYCRRYLETLAPLFNYIVAYWTGDTSMVTG